MVVLQKERIKLKIVIVIAALFPLIFLSGCESFNSSTEKIKPVNDQLRLDRQGRPVSDPIAEFVVNTVPGNTGTVVMQDGRIFSVKVGSDYISATGRKCRNILMGLSQSQIEKNAVCYIENSWKTVLAW